MPKRTNNFQKFVTIVERLAASPTARVIESSEELEQPDSSPREMDVLIEDTVGGHDVRIAIECRNHSRRQDKTWIDALIGKYRDLRVDIIYAVSSSGFTKGALEKARQGGIRTMTLRQAVDADWAKAFVREPKVRFSGHAVGMQGVRLILESEGPDFDTTADNSDWRIEGPNGEDPSTVRETAMSLFARDAAATAEDYIAANKLRDMTSSAEPAFDFFQAFEATERYLCLPSGGRRRIKQFLLRLVGSVKHFEPDQREHFVLGPRIATVATLDSELAGTHMLTVVQLEGDPAKSLRWALVSAPRKTKPAAIDAPPSAKTAKKPRAAKKSVKAGQPERGSARRRSNDR